MTKLSVNINKIATLRNARGGNQPNVIKAAVDCEHYGAQGITVHPRPDERHIRYQDVRELKPVIRTELNVEGYPSSQFMALVREVIPHQVTLVPDPPDVITSNAGWDCKKEASFLKDIVAELKASGMRVSLFLDPDPQQVEAAQATGADRIELYTEFYARHYHQNPTQAIKAYRETAIVANDAGLGINAGHDLNLNNLAFFAAEIPDLLEVSIGHALICDALYYGLSNTIPLYLIKLSVSQILPAE